MTYTDNALVNEVWKCPYLEKCNQIDGKTLFSLKKCELCNEINLWAYCQGERKKLDANISLV